MQKGKAKPKASKAKVKDLTVKDDNVKGGGKKKGGIVVDFGFGQHNHILLT